MLDWSTVDTVMFDMDGTLLDLHYDNHFWEHVVPLTWGQREGLSLAQAWERIGVLYGEHGGTLNWYCIDFWSEQLQLDIRALKTQTQDRIALRPLALTLLKQLRRSAKHILLVTNAHPDTLELKMLRMQLQQHFDAMISSHELGLAKEEQGFWTSLQQRHNYNPARTLLVDDNEAVLRSAGDHGIAHLLAIAQPDSQRPPLPAGAYVQLQSFADIMPDPASLVDAANAEPREIKAERTLSND